MQDCSKKTEYMHSKSQHRGSNETTLAIIGPSTITGNRKSQQTNKWSMTPTKRYSTPRPTSTVQSSPDWTSVSLRRIDARKQEQLDPIFTIPTTIPSASYPPYRQTMGRWHQRKKRSWRKTGAAHGILRTPSNYYSTTLRTVMSHWSAYGQPTQMTRLLTGT